MRHTSIDTVVPGQILARSIYTQEGRTLLHSGVQLTVGMVNKLRNLGVTMLYIQDERLDDVHLDEMVSEEIRREAMRNIADILDKVQTGKDFQIKNLQSSAENIISEIMKNKDLLLDLSDIRTNDNEDYLHALNVCLMSTVTAINLGLRDSQLYDLAIGALLHDIGKMLPGEEEDHTWKGFNYLRKRHDISILSAHVALQHHEYIDGTGKPRGVKGDEVHLFGKIVAVANFYDRLISPSGNKKPYLPYEACEYIMGLADKKFDHEVVRQFLRSVAFYPTGSSVKLSTGEVAIVVEQHKGLPTRPILRVIKDHRDDDLPEVKEIDLAKSTTTFIEKIII